MAIWGKQLLVSFALLLLSCSMIHADVVNTTVSLPQGTSDYGEPNLLCLPTGWTDVAVFFLGNYFAHAVTVINTPGASFLDTIFAGVTALFMPVSGVNRGLNALFSLAKFAPTDVQQAARAGALCEVTALDGDRDQHTLPQWTKVYLNRR